VLVRPYYDASLSGSLSMDGMFGGQTRVRTFIVSTDRRALASARFLAANAPPALLVEAITAAGANCRVEADLGGICEFSNLPADARQEVSVTYRALDGWWVVDPVVSISTPGDVDSRNNTITARVETLGTTDVELRVGASAGGVKASSLSFPTIQLLNGGNKAMTPRLEVALPEGMSVVSVSASDGVCSGSSTLRCDFDTLEPFSQATVSLVVRASIDGSFTSKVSVSSANDVNPANDASSVALDISNVNVAANNGAAGGGGGRIEWLLLGFLAWLVQKRARAIR